MKFKNFSDTLRENLESYEDTYAPFIDFGPELFTLLCDILNKEDLSKESRLEINSAIAYYVVSDDMIPEEIYGPYGYIDDIFVSVYVLRHIADIYGYDFLQEVWRLDTNVKDIMDDCYDHSLELLEDKVYPILSYCGLVD